MKNPWESIPFDVYEKHMKLDDIQLLQSLNKMMKGQMDTYASTSIMILGCAGGNGLEHVDTKRIHKVVGVDINADYLSACLLRCPHLQSIWEPILIDLKQDVSMLPHIDFMIANVIIEYIGYDSFIRVLTQVEPLYVSCVMQKNIDESFVSTSPYLSVFDRQEEMLLEKMLKQGYKKILSKRSELPNGKVFLRLDFQKIVWIKDGYPYQEEIKALIKEYVQSLQRDLSFQSLDEELADLLYKYGKAHGNLFAAMVNEKIVGCVAYQKLNEQQCEMKRLYVQPAFRKQGIAQQLLIHCLSRAKQDGYQEMVLDTIAPLQNAIALYKKFDFQEIDPYYDNPMEDVIYMGRKL